MGLLEELSGVLLEAPQRFERWAMTFGISTATFIKTILVSRLYPQHSYKSCFTILGFGKKYGPVNLELACKIALENDDVTYRRVKLILEYHLDGG